jgi:uncharacterized membrane protein YjjP (DUF1212 family)
MEEAAHLSLELNGLLLQNGADTAQVQDAVARFAAGLGYEAHLLVSYHALLLTTLSACLILLLLKSKTVPVRICHEFSL